MIELLYAVLTLTSVVVGLSIVGMGVRAYVQTSRKAMLYLSLGFGLAVAGAAATMMGAFLTDFAKGPLASTQSLLLVNSGLTSFGYMFVMYSLISYES